MKAGRELDALIAEKVMGATVVYPYRSEPGHPYPGVNPIWTDEPWQATSNPQSISGLENVPHYSTNIADAWMVVEKMGRWHGFDFMIVMPDPEQTFHLRTYEAGWYEATNDGPERRVVSYADTAPLAICLAALKAVSQEGQG